MDGGDYTMDKEGGVDSWEISEGFLGGMASKQVWGVVIALLIVAIFLILWACGAFNKSDNFVSNIYQGARYQSIPSDNITGDNRLDQDDIKWQQENFYDIEGMIPGREDAFIGGRETPYFSDVTNRVLRLENRENEAIRALAKINQEKLRRQAERPDATIPWDSYWAEWKRANPLGEEQLI